MTERVWNPVAQQFDAPPVTLAEFLTAQFTHEERLARNAESVWQVIGRDPKPYPGVAHKPDDWMKAEAFSLNINPWFVLKQCEAKRRIVELHALVSADYRHGWWVSDGTPATELTPTGCNNCRSCGVDGEQYVEDGPCATLRLLALPYADHPDYREEWRA